MENATVNGSTAENHANATSCYGLTPYWANMFRPFDDPDFPWFGLWFALPIIQIWYWCTDQVGCINLRCVHWLHSAMNLPWPTLLASHVPMSPSDQAAILHGS